MQPLIQRVRVLYIQCRTFHRYIEHSKQSGRRVRVRVRVQVRLPGRRERAARVPPREVRAPVRIVRAAPPASRGTVRSTSEQESSRRASGEYELEIIELGTVFV